MSRYQSFLVDKFCSLPIGSMEEVVGEMLNNLNGQQADGKQNQIQQDNFLIPLRCRRNKLVHGEGGRN